MFNIAYTTVFKWTAKHINITKPRYSINYKNTLPMLCNKAYATLFVAYVKIFTAYANKKYFWISWYTINMRIFEGGDNSISPATFLHSSVFTSELHAILWRILNDCLKERILISFLLLLFFQFPYNTKIWVHSYHLLWYSCFFHYIRDEEKI